MVQCSVVIPAYNESLRLPGWLPDLHAELDRLYGASHEILIVDDGSADDLPAALAAAQAGPHRMLRLDRNRGKGAAVRTGMLAATGAVRAYMDADGAADPAELARLALALADGADIAAGVRIAGNGAERTLSRGVLGKAFASLARTSLGLPVRDPQCGLKMLRGPVAAELFAAMREDGYLFDLEMFTLAARRRLRIAEVPIQWTERAGSKVRPLGDGLRMVAGLARIRTRRAA